LRLRNVPQEKCAHRLERLPPTALLANTPREVLVMPQAIVVALVMFVPIQELLDHSRFPVKKANSLEQVSMESHARQLEMVTLLKEVKVQKEFAHRVSIAIILHPSSLLHAQKVLMVLQLV
jgi:hypothetical protein